MNLDTGYYQSRPSSFPASNQYPSHPLERAIEAFNRFQEAFQNFSESLTAPESHMYTSPLQKPIWSQRSYYDRPYYPSERLLYDELPHYDKLHNERPYHYFEDYRYHHPIYADEPIYQKPPMAKTAMTKQQTEKLLPRANKHVIIAAENGLHNIPISHPNVRISDRNPKNTQIEPRINSVGNPQHYHSTGNHESSSNKVPLSLVAEVLPHIFSDTIFEDGLGSRHHVTFDRAHKLLDEMLNKGKPDITLKKDDDLFNIGDDFGGILRNFGQKAGTVVSGTSYQTSNITKDGKTVTVSRQSKLNPDGTVSTKVSQHFDDGKGQTDAKSRKKKFMLNPTANASVDNQNLTQQQNQEQQHPNQQSQTNEKRIPEIEQIGNLFQEVEDSSISQAPTQQDQKVEATATSSQK